MNHVILIGRLSGDPEIIKTENESFRTVVNLAVPRTYKNMDGIYETDFIRCVLWNGIAERANEYCKKVTSYVFEVVYKFVVTLMNKVRKNL